VRVGRSGVVPALRKSTSSFLDMRCEDAQPESNILETFIVMHSAGVTFDLVRMRREWNRAWSEVLDLHVCSLTWGIDGASGMAFLG
jgi:hypothetical protein